MEKCHVELLIHHNQEILCMREKLAVSHMYCGAQEGIDCEQKLRDSGKQLANQKI